MGRTDARVRQRLGPKRTGGVAHWFTRFANRVSEVAGSHWTFVVTILLILVWAFTGPLFGYSSDWQLAVNTGTTIVTFLMVFIIQNTQNRDAKAMHLKLDELLRATPRARKAFMDAEEEDLSEIAREKEIVDRDDPYPPEDTTKNGRPKETAAQR
jgi:low affinity Fe/Cu permease